MSQHKPHDRDDEDVEDGNVSDEISGGGDNQQIFTALKRIQDQLGYLERKIDQILAGGQGGGGRPSFPRKDFGGRPPMRDRGQGGGGFRSGGDRPFRPAGDRPFRPSGDRPFYKGRERGGDRDRGGDSQGGGRERSFPPRDPGARPWKKHSGPKRPH